MRSRRRKPYKRPRQQPDEATDTSHAHTPLQAATPEPEQAPQALSSQALQQAHKRPRAGSAESVGAPGRQPPQQPHATQIAEALTPAGIQTPGRAASPWQRVISQAGRSQRLQNTPAPDQDAEVGGGETPQRATPGAQQQEGPAQTPGKQQYPDIIASPCMAVPAITQQRPQ